MKVLVADDDPTVRLLVTAHLEAAGHQVEAVDDGSAVVEAVRTAVPDALVIDAMMPVDGWAVIERLRKDPRWAAVPVVLLSARDLPDDVRRGYATGASLVMSKDDDLSTLAEQLEALHRRR